MNSNKEVLNALLNSKNTKSASASRVQNISRIEEDDVEEASYGSPTKLLGVKRPRTETKVVAKGNTTGKYQQKTAEEKLNWYKESRARHKEREQICANIAGVEGMEAYLAECARWLATFRVKHEQCVLCLGYGHSIRSCPWFKKLADSLQTLKDDRVEYLYYLKSESWLNLAKKSAGLDD